MEQEGAEGLEQALRFSDDLTPGDAKDGPAGSSQPLISLSILLEGGDGAVDAAAVSFDDQAGIAPDEVRHQRNPLDEQVTVDLGRPKAAALEQSQELLLKLEAGLLFLGIMILDAQSEASDSSPALAPFQQLDDFSQIEGSLDFSLVDRIPKRVRRLSSGDVEQGAGQAGARDAVDLHPIGESERPIPVGSDSIGAPPAPIGGDDVHTAARVVQDVVEIRSGSVG